MSSPPFIRLTMTLERPSRELSATEIINMSFDLYSSRFIYFFIPFLFSNIINSAFRYALEYLILPRNVPEIGGDVQRFMIDNFLYLLVFFVSIMFVWWVTSTIANGVAVEYASSLLERGEVDIERGFLIVVYNLKTLLAAGLVTGVLTVLGLLCFIVPGVILMIMFALVIPVIVIEQRGALESLGRSRKLVDKGWGKTLTVIIMTGIIMVVVGIIGEMLGLVVYQLRDLVSAVVISLAQPIQPIALTYLYYSMRVKEHLAAAPITPTVPAAPEPKPVVPVETYPRFCYICGQEVPPDAIFCPRCGRQVRRPSSYPLRST